MNPNKWKKVKEIFAVAVELPMIEREKFLAENLNGDDEIRLKVEEMIRADEDESLENPLINLSDFWDENEVETFVGKQIGAYKIGKEIGRGGMGVVFEAIHETEDVTQKVALKILKRGLESEAMVRRFRNERKILASLEHPNIARLIDGGTTDNGSPFFVMEFVEGVPIDEFCKDLSLDEKLKLFQQVCKAVSYAHTRLIVHRDLKPSNILVNADGTAKLLDFGIAKLLSDNTFGEKGTATQLGMMTPNYASPEQFRGEQVTTATDIYSLGVILYELLTGVLPYDLQDKTLDKVFEILTKSETLKPSSVNSKFKIQNSKLIPTDVDNIVLKSLKKEPERRYQSVKDFSEDISRYLNGLPISARPDTFGYRASKFIQRNKFSVIAVSLVILSLIGGLIGISYQYTVAQRERALAEKRFADVRELANKVVFRYHDEIQKLNGSTALRKELAQDAVKYLDSLNPDEIDDNRLKLELARAYLKLGDVQGGTYQSNIGDTKGAEESYQKAFTLLEKLNAELPEDVEIRTNYSLSLLQIGRILTRRVEIERAVETMQKALKIAETLPTQNSGNIRQMAQIYIALGDSVSRNSKKTILQNFEGANPYFEKALDLSANLTSQKESLPNDFFLLGIAYQRLGNLNFTVINLSASMETTALYLRAGEYHGKSIEALRKAAESDPDNIKNKRTLADEMIMAAPVFARLGDVRKAKEYSRFAEEQFEKLSAADIQNWELKYDLAMTYYQSATMFQVVKDNATGYEKMKKAVELLEQLHAENIDNKEILVDISSGYGRIMTMELELGNPNKALTNLQKSNEIMLERYGAETAYFDHVCRGYITFINTTLKLGNGYKKIAGEAFEKLETYYAKSSKQSGIGKSIEEIKAQLN